MDSNTLIGLITGAGVFMFFAGLAAHLSYARWQSRLQASIGAFVEPTITGVRQQEAPTPSSSLADRMNSRVRQLNVIPKLRIQLAAAGIGMPASRFLLLQVGLTIVGALLGMALLASQPSLRLVGMLLGAVICYQLPRVYVSLRRKRRIKALENQLPDAVDVLAGALEAGSSLPQSMAMIGREMGDPISTEFNRVVRDQELGLNQQEALARMLERCPSPDLDMLITSINIQYRVGGNLAKVLQTISHTIRERMRIRGEIKTLTAQGRISAKVISGVPFGIVGVITLINRPYMMQLFTSTVGWALIGTALFMVVFGYLVMIRVVSIKV